MEDVKEFAKKTWRQTQAESTRRQILSAARRVFAERGYVAATVDAIAEEAGVAVPTVYKIFKTKAAIVLSLADLLDVECDIPMLAMEMAQSNDPDRVIEIIARIGRNIFERCSDITNGLEAASLVSPDAAAAFAEGRRRHRMGSSFAVRKLKDLDVLRPELEMKDAEDTLAILTGNIYKHIALNTDWSAEKIEQWVLATIHSLLVTKNSKPRSTKRVRS